MRNLHKDSIVMKEGIDLKKFNKGEEGYKEMVEEES